MSDEQALQELRDREEIREVMAAYCHTMDGRDEKGFRGIWTDDAVYDVGGAFGAFTGPDKIAEGAGLIWGAFTETHHWNANISIRAAGPDLATATSNVVAHLVDAAGNFVLNSSDYEDVFVRSAGAWRFRERKITINYLRQVPSSPYGG